MGLASIFSVREYAGPTEVEYGPDGDYWRSAFTPWPGIIQGTADIPYVTRQQAEGLPGIGRGVELITTVLSQLSPRLYRHLEQPLEITERMPTPPLLQNPDPSRGHGLPEWLVAAGADLAWYGDAFSYRGVEVTDYRGWPLRLPLLPASRMHWEEGTYVYTRADGQRENLSPGDVVHFVMNARTESRFGLGILDRYQTELKIMIATEGSQYVIMKDGRPMGILSLGIDVNEEQAAAYKKGFLKAVSENGVAALGNADFKPVQWSSSDLNMVPTREYNLRLASDIVGVPPYLLGVPAESRVYSNMENEWTTFLRVSLARYTKALESGLTGCFPRGTSVMMDTDVLLRSDASTRFGTYATAISAGILTVDEVRQREDLPPLPKAEPVVPALPPAADNPDENDADEEAQDG